MSVRLNVGGKSIQTTLSTIRSIPKLERIVKNHQSDYFIDADPKDFQTILDCVRDGRPIDQSHRNLGILMGLPGEWIDSKVTVWKGRPELVVKTIQEAKPIVLHVGGKRFTTTTNTIRSSQYLVQQGSAFIDRNPDRFRSLLRLLRHNYTRVDRSLVEELKLFQIPYCVSRSLRYPTDPTVGEKLWRLGSCAVDMTVDHTMQSNQSIEHAFDSTVTSKWGHTIRSIQASGSWRLAILMNQKIVHDISSDWIELNSDSVTKQEFQEAIEVPIPIDRLLAMNVSITIRVWKQSGTPRLRVLHSWEAPDTLEKRWGDLEIVPMTISGIAHDTVNPSKNYCRLASKGRFNVAFESLPFKTGQRVVLPAIDADFSIERLEEAPVWYAIRNDLVI